MRTSGFAIRATNLGKRYAIGEREAYLTLRDLLSRAIRLSNQAPRNGRNGRLDHVWALKHASLEVGEGEAVGLIGRNGAGKTTLLKILARVTKPTEGDAEIRGRMGSLLEVGTGFHSELTGRENVQLSGAILGMSGAEIRRKFDEIVSFAEVDRFVDTPLKHFSTGMQMRLAFAVAAHLEPEILLVDEVLAVGDAAFQKKCLGKMEDVAHAGRTIVFVSHNMTAMRSLCARGYVLDRGRISFSGPMGDCIDHYLAAARRDTCSEIATADLPRRSSEMDDDTLRIVKIHLESGAQQGAIYTGQPLTVEMELDVARPVKEVVVGVSVHSSDGVRLFECRSNETHDAFILLPGRYTIECTLPQNPLNPGWYNIHVGARSSAKGLDYLPAVMTFQVESAEKLETMWLDARDGFVRTSSVWTMPNSHA